MPRSSIRSMSPIVCCRGPRELKAKPLSHGAPSTLVGVMHASVHVRRAAEKDLDAINDIYNHYIVQSHVTFDEQPMSLDARAEWFSHYSDAGRHRLLVATEGDVVAGYASSS